MQGAADTPNRRGLERLHTNTRFLKEQIAYTILPLDQTLSAEEVEKQTLAGRISRGALIALTAAVDAADDDGYIFVVLQTLAERSVLARTTFARYFQELQRGRHPFVTRVPTHAKNGGPKPRFELIVLPIDSRADRITLRLQRPMPAPVAEWGSTH